MTTTTVTDTAARNAAKTYADCYVRQQQIKTEMEERIAAIQTEYAAELKKLEEKTEKCSQTIEEFAEANREDLFMDAKTAKIGAVQFGFKLNPAKLDLKPGWKWDKALLKVKELYPDYIKVKEELDKTRLKNDADKLGKDLGKCGMQVVQEEKFVIKIA